MRTAFARDAPTTIHRRRFGFVRMSARIAVLISGEGRNLQALIDACADGRIDGQIVCVLSNRAEAGGVRRAQRAGIATEVLSHRDYASRADFDAAMLARLAVHPPDFVGMAGFMRILTPTLITQLAGRLPRVEESRVGKECVSTLRYLV